jgi:hypothetical protein
VGWLWAIRLTQSFPIADNPTTTPAGTILLYPQQCHPERSEGSAFVFESFKVALLPGWRQYLNPASCGAIRE